jgi:hypothetical protein
MPKEASDLLRQAARRTPGEGFRVIPRCRLSHRVLKFLPHLGARPRAQQYVILGGATQGAGKRSTTRTEMPGGDGRAASLVMNHDAPAVFAVAN